MQTNRLNWWRKAAGRLMATSPRTSRFESGNYCRFTVRLTDAQSQGTKVASTVARDGKTEGISRPFY